ncbi:YeeE/YedE thiosulfate transporter family protein [Desulfonatronum parangueonense]
MKNDGGWSPYVAGGLSGLLGVMSVWLTGQFFGASTSFVRTAGMIEQWFGPERVAQLEYFTRVVPRIDWQWMFVVGIVLGSLVSAATSGSFRWQSVPDMWHKRFGHTPVKRAVLAFSGGVVAMFGARLADG